MIARANTAATFPSEDSRRYEILKELDVLGSPPEPEFDQITKVLAEFLKCPCAAISLIDGDRIWFKSKVGIHETEVPSKNTPCARVVESLQELVVDGIPGDQPLSVSPLVLGSIQAQFYAGVPLVSTGVALGTLFVMDVESRSIDLQHLELMKILSKFVVLLMERKKLQHLENFVEAHGSLATIGEIASGIAHEIKNPLTVILTRTSHARFLLRQKCPDIGAVLGVLAKIENAIERIARISKNLCRLSRFSHNEDEEEPYAPVFFSRLLQDVVELAQHRLESAQIKLIIDPYEDQTIECRFVQISQVFLNLINNSIDAIKGTPDPWIRIKVQFSPDFLVVHFIDSGLGISRSIADQIMKPFFSTKKASEGTGLGLNICQKIISSHQGVFTLVPEAPNTTFIVKIPKHQANIHL